MARANDRNRNAEKGVIPVKLFRTKGTKINYGWDKKNTSYTELNACARKIKHGSGQKYWR